MNFLSLCVRQLTGTIIWPSIWIMFRTSPRRPTVYPARGPHPVPIPHGASTASPPQAHTFPVASRAAAFFFSLSRVTSCEHVQTQRTTVSVLHSLRGHRNGRAHSKVPCSCMRERASGDCVRCRRTVHAFSSNFICFFSLCFCIVLLCRALCSILRAGTPHRPHVRFRRRRYAFSASPKTLFFPCSASASPSASVSAGLKGPRYESQQRTPPDAATASQLQLRRHCIRFATRRCCRRPIFLVIVARRPRPRSRSHSRARVQHRSSHASYRIRRPRNQNRK